MQKFIFHGVIKRNSNKFKATCLELDIGIEGKSQDEARRNLKKAVSRYIDSVKMKSDKLISNPLPEELVKKYSGGEVLWCWY